MGVLLAKSMGNHVTVISTSNKKEALAKQVGADNYVISKDEESMVFWFHEFFFKLYFDFTNFFQAANAQTLDLVLDTIPMGHDINPYMTLLKKKGTINIIGAFPDPPFQVKKFLAKKKNESIFKDFFFCKFHVGGGHQKVPSQKTRKMK